MGLLNNIFGSNKPQPQRIHSTGGMRVNAVAKNHRSPAVIKSYNSVNQNKRAFEAAKIDRTVYSWNTNQTSINWDIRQGLAILRARSIELSHSDPYAKKYFNSLEKYVVGPEGFTHRNKAYNYKQTNEGWKLEFDKSANKIIQDAFWRWGKKDYCTITGDLSLRQVLGLTIKTEAIVGEAFLKKIYVSNKVNPYGFTLQFIPAAYCDETLNKALPNGNTIIMGIEYTPFGKPVAYYFRKVTQEQELYSYEASKTYVRISADQVYHKFRKEYVGQKRGIPWLTASAMRLHILKGYEDAALMNARSAARKSNVLEPVTGESGELTTSNTQGTETDSNGDIIRDIVPGETYVVPSGYKFVDYDPSYPQGEHGPFTQTILQGASSGMDFDYPSLSSNLSGVNYTSSRTGKLDSNLTFKRIQSDLKEDLLEPLHTDWLEAAMLNDAFPYSLPISKIEKFNQPLFLGFTPDWTDPLKDGKAKIMLNQNNLETLEKLAADKGYDLEELLDQLEFEKKELIRRGLSVEAKLEDNSVEDGGSQGDNKDSDINRNRIAARKYPLIDVLDTDDIKEAIYEILDEKRSNGKH